MITCPPYLARALSIFISLGVHTLVADDEFTGQFIGDLIMKDTGGEREFELVQAFKYLDPQRTLWIVPEETVVDGASIPPYLWSFVGAPWTGEYRRASVIHDYFFEQKKYDSDSVHRVFYDAMLRSGVKRWKALLMYYAVLRFNDRWERDVVDNYHCIDESILARGINCYPVLADDVGIEVRFLKKESRLR